mmetsp:Transcript_37341/g.68845  ORF Transcript_37341/g.68845 Transcript_37341/m.68845 type:complete len:112 (+) Transcript_37341:939-1274(+)
MVRTYDRTHEPHGHRRASKGFFFFPPYPVRTKHNNNKKTMGGLRSKKELMPYGLDAASHSACEPPLREKLHSPCTGPAPPLVLWPWRGLFERAWVAIRACWAGRAGKPGLV